MPDLEFSEDDMVQLSLLRDEETDALIDAGFLGEDQRLSSPMDDLLCFTYEELVLQVTAGIHYPVTAPCFDLNNLTLSRKDIDSLRATLRWVIENAAETNCIEKWLDRESSEYGIFKATKVVLHLAQEVDVLVKAVRGRTQKEDDQGDGEEKREPWEQRKASEAITTNEIALEYLRKSAKEICETIPSCYRVLHAECVIRHDLAARFDACRDRLREKLLRHRNSLPKCCTKHTRLEDKVEHLVRPHITFHGTQRHFVPTIVRHGFLKPGSRVPKGGKGVHGNMHEVRCGSTYGCGIYSSPSADFSLSYSDHWARPTSPTEYFGLKLIVCATIMGRPRQMFREDNWRQQSEPYEGADSHVANRELEYIVFDPAQIIPVYVLHLDWGADNADHFANLPLDANQWKPRVSPAKNKLNVNEGLDSVYAGERQRARQAVFAKAAKYFPYGYGPATGGRFVIEEVGEVSEDEEEYGEYQAMRGKENDDETEKSQTNFWGWVKAAEEDEGGRPDRGKGSVPADEYTAERRGFGSRPENWDSIKAARWEKVEEEDDDNDGSLNLDRLLFG
ncbi:parp domain-containing protein [Colletotrichum sojae]|uniref:Parp domain-containing protein n=1 Tax=Colletotrichum sojae TaxID=2175907 RepID=A0A8H6JGZ4_9PEZI|nr:parp domain-containing protein [Colletotrichum sojae]